MGTCSRQRCPLLTAQGLLTLGSYLSLWVRPDLHVRPREAGSLSPWLAQNSNIIERPSACWKRNWHLKISFPVTASELWGKETAKGSMKDTERACLRRKHTQRTKGESLIRKKPLTVTDIKGKPISPLKNKCKQYDQTLEDTLWDNKRKQWKTNKTFQK